MDIRDWKKLYGGYLSAVNDLQQDATLKTDAEKKKLLAKNKSHLNCGLRKLPKFILGKYDVSHASINALVELFQGNPFMCNGCEKQLLRLFGKVSLYEDVAVRNEAVRLAEIMDNEVIYHYLNHNTKEADVKFFVSWIGALADDYAQAANLRKHLMTFASENGSCYLRSANHENLLNLLKS